MGTSLFMPRPFPGGQVTMSGHALPRGLESPAGPLPPPQTPPPLPRVGSHAQTSGLPPGLRRTRTPPRLPTGDPAPLLSGHAFFPPKKTPPVARPASESRRLSPGVSSGPGQSGFLYLGQRPALPGRRGRCGTQAVVSPASASSKEAQRRSQKYSFWPRRCRLIT